MEVIQIRGKENFHRVTGPDRFCAGSGPDRAWGMVWDLQALETCCKKFQNESEWEQKQVFFQVEKKLPDVGAAGWTPESVLEIVCVSKDGLFLSFVVLNYASAFWLGIGWDLVPNQYGPSGSVMAFVLRAPSTVVSVSIIMTV